MQPITLLSICCLYSILSVAALNWDNGFGMGSGSRQVALGGKTGNDDRLAVPGDNPMEYCDKTTSGYSLAIERVDLAPNPPAAGQTLFIQAAGTFSEPVAAGAYVKLVVKYGYITLVKMTLDLCEQMAEVDESCPLEGAVVVRKEVDLPKDIPPGKYSVFADVYSTDDKQVTCLTAHVRF